MGGHRHRHPRRVGGRSAAVARKHALTATVAESRGVPTRWRGRAQHLGLALVAYVPLLFTHRGMVERGHQDVPLPRSRPPARKGALPLGLRHRSRHRDPPDHRLPVPDGALLLVDASSSDCPTGWRNASGSARSSSPRERACSSSCGPWDGGPPTRCARGHDRRRRGLHALAVRPRLRGPDLGHPAAMGRAPLARRPRRALRAARVAGAGRRGSHS